MLKTSIALALLGFAVPAFGDTHITFVNDSGQPSSQMFVKGGKMRMEFNDGAHAGFMIYDLASNSMTMFMPEQKKYLVFNEQAAGQIGAQSAAAQQQLQGAQQQAQAQMAAHQDQMDQANQEMQQKLASMPPEQRAMMEKMMAARGGNPMATNPMAALQDAGAPQMEMKDLGTTESVAGHTCKDMQMTINGRASSTMCVIDSPAALGIPAADMKSMQAMRDAMQKLSAKMGPMAQGMSAMMSKGFALKTTKQVFDPKTMKASTETDTFKSLTTESLDNSLFQTPAGYTQTSMDEMMQGHHP